MLALVHSDAPILREQAVSVTDITTQVMPYLSDMSFILQTHKALGIAAPQVGLPYRFFLYRDDTTKTEIVAINPEIMMSTTANRISWLEGCLSFPRRTTYISRPASILVRWTDVFGVVHSPDTPLTGMEARVFQHELDHLDGKCIFG